MNGLVGDIWHIYSPLKHSYRVSKHKEHVDKVNYNGIQYPVKLQDTPKIEKINDKVFNNFLCLRTNFLNFPMLKILKKIFVKTCDLLLIEENDKRYYVWVKFLKD